jgi:hypothetical protein
VLEVAQVVLDMLLDRPRVLGRVPAHARVDDAFPAQGRTRRKLRGKQEPPRGRPRYGNAGRVTSPGPWGLRGEARNGVFSGSGIAAGPRRTGALEPPRV